MPPDLAFAGVARLLVVLHAAAAIVLIGATTHHALIAWGYVRGRTPLGARLRLGRIYAATVAVAYGVTFALGLLAYPTFRYAVRGLYLDRYEVWAANLFDIKENFAALGLPLVALVLGVSRVLHAETERAVLLAYAACGSLVAAIVWFDTFSGLVIALTRGM